MSMTTEELLALSEARGYIEVPAELAGLDAASVLLPSGRCAWSVSERGINGAEYRGRLGHEMGHCETGAFYTRFSAPSARGKCEELAERWQIRNMLPRSALRAAMRQGARTSWELAEFFDLPEPLILRAVAYYRLRRRVKPGK